MITLYIEVPYASFRKSFARSYAETYRLPPPSTVYGMLLSLVGEKFRSEHAGVKLAFAFKRVPQVAVTLRKLSRLKYGVAAKQSTLGNAPDFVETVCGIQMLCWVNSGEELSNTASRSLEERLIEAIQQPEKVNRYGLLCLGLSDDQVDEVSLQESNDGYWHRLIPCAEGSLELPTWVDHLGSANTSWQRFELDLQAAPLSNPPGNSAWPWVEMKRS